MMDPGMSYSAEVSECVAWVYDSGPVASHMFFLPLSLCPRDREREGDRETDGAGTGRGKSKITFFFSFIKVTAIEFNKQEG